MSNSMKSISAEEAAAMFYSIFKGENTGFEDSQLGLLQLTIQHAKSKSVFYRERFLDDELVLSSVDDLDKFPLITKKELSENNEKVIVPHERAIMQHTTGTTGIPLDIYKSVDEVKYINKFRQCLMRHERRNNLRPIILSFPNIYHGCLVSNDEHDFILQGGIHDDLMATQTVEYLTRKFSIPGYESKVSVILGLYFYIQGLTSYLLQLDYDFSRTKIDFIISTGGFLSDRWKNIITKYWNAKLVNKYSCTEAFGGANECSKCGAFHMDPYLISEVIDPHTGQTISEGTGILVLTSLFPFVMMQPIIRYVTNDIITIVKNDCSNQFSFLFHGRYDNSVHIVEKGKTIYLLNSADLYNILENYPDIESELYFTDLSKVTDYTSGGRLRFEVKSGKKNGKVYILVTIPLKYIPELFPERSDELRKNIIADLCSTNVEFKTWFLDNKIVCNIKFVGPGKSNSFSLKI